MGASSFTLRRTVLSRFHLLMISMTRVVLVRSTLIAHCIYIPRDARRLYFYDGEHESDAKVFPDFKDKMTGTTLKNRLKAAGITKHIIFHCSHHTFGYLQVDAGTGIYTVQHMLGYKNVETTQIYANMADESKRESVNRITLKPKITPQLKVVGQG